MQTKHSTTEGCHDGIGIPSSTLPFAVANKNKKQKDRTMKTINTLTFAALAATLLFQTPIARADNNGAATINFTKWVTALNPRPGVLADMAGIIVGGDVGGDVGD